MALTESQIRSRINTLTRENSNYTNQKNSYRTSLKYANNLVNSLNNSSNYLGASNDYMKRYFTINKKTGDGGKIITVKNNISEILKKLNTRVIPDINNNIANLEKKIRNNNTEISRLKKQLNEIRKT